jgi:hypothetical protein
MRHEQNSDRRGSDIGYGIVLGTALTSVVVMAALDIKKGQQKESIVPESFHTDVVPADNGFTVVYKNQKQPNCIGEIEKTVPQVNEKGEVTGMTVFCKPEEVVVPAK